MDISEENVREDNYEFELETQQKIVALLYQDFTYLSTVGILLSYCNNGSTSLI